MKSSDIYYQNKAYDRKLNNDTINDEQRQAILDQGKKKKAEMIFLNRGYFRYPGCHCHVDTVNSRYNEP